MSQIRGIIFDVDGTLVDSNDAHWLTPAPALPPLLVARLQPLKRLVY